MPKANLLSAAEIAALRLPGLPTTKARVIERAAAEEWPYEERTGLGGKRRMYALPERYTSEFAPIARVEETLVNELGYARDLIGRNVAFTSGKRGFRIDLAIYTDAAAAQKQQPENILIAIDVSGENMPPPPQEALLARFSMLPGLRWAMWTNLVMSEVFERTKLGDGSETWNSVESLPRASSLRLERLRDARKDEGMSDAALLEAIIEGVERFGLEVGDALTPQRKATLISLFYRYFRDEGSVDQQKLADMLRKVA